MVVFLDDAFFQPRTAIIIIIIIDTQTTDHRRSQVQPVSFHSAVASTDGRRKLCAEATKQKDNYSRPSTSLLNVP